MQRRGFGAALFLSLVFGGACSTDNRVLVVRDAAPANGGGGTVGSGGAPGSGGGSGGAASGGLPGSGGGSGGVMVVPDAAQDPPPADAGETAASPCVAGALLCEDFESY